MNHRRLLWISIILTLIIAGCGQSNQTEADKYIHSARSFVAQKKLETAVIEYRNAIAKDPRNHTALFELAETFVLLQKINTAIRYYNLAAKADPGFTAPRLRLAQIYFQTDRLMEARSEISAVLKQAPESVNAFHILSGIQIKERDLTSAVATLEKAEILDPGNVKTLVSLAQLYIKSRQIQKGTAAYQRAMAQDPDSRAAYMGLARLYAGQKKWEKAEALLKSVVDTPGNKAQKHMDLAAFYEGRKRFDLAETQYGQAVATASDKVMPSLALARFYTRRKRKTDAVSVLEAALKHTKAKAVTLNALSQVYLYFKDLENAEKAVDQALHHSNRLEGALFQKGKIRMARQDFKGALNLFDQVIAQNRIHAKAFYLRAVCIKKRGATDRPEQKIFRAAAGMLDDPESYEREQIEENLMAAVTIDPGLIEARFELASLYILEKRTDKANQQINAILNARKPDHRTMTLVAGIKLLEGKVGEAEAIYKTIIDQRPEYMPAYIRLGLMYQLENKPEQARRYLEKAFLKDSRQLGLAQRIVALYTEAGQFDRALEKIDAYQDKAEAGSAAFWENLRGETLLQMGKPGPAQDYFLKAADQSPDYIRPLMNLANGYREKGDSDKALDYYRRIETIDPDYLPALLSAGVLLDSREDLNGAMAYYEKVLKINPRQPLAANNLAFILSEDTRRLEEAFRLAKIAREQRPGDPNVLDTLGWIYFQKGSYLSALSEFEDSLRINPDNALTHFHYGMTLYKTKSYEKAREHLKKALAMSPDFRGADRAREMLY